MIEARVVCQLMRCEGLLLWLTMHVMQLEGIHVLEMGLLMLELWLQLRLEWVERGGRMSSMQATVQSALRGRHRQRRT